MWFGKGGNLKGGKSFLAKKRRVYVKNRSVHGLFLVLFESFNLKLKKFLLSNRSGSFVWIFSFFSRGNGNRDCDRKSDKLP